MNVLSFSFDLMFFLFGLAVVGVVAGLNAYIIAIIASRKIKKEAPQEYSNITGGDTWSADRGYVKAEDLTGWWRLYKVLYKNKKIFEEINYFKHKQYVVSVWLITLFPLSFLSIAGIMAYLFVVYAR